MRYSITLRTYDPSDCTSTGIRIQANRTTLAVSTRSCWQGSRTHRWVYRCDDGLAAAKDLHKLAMEVGSSDALEQWGFTDENAKVSAAIR